MSIHRLRRRRRNRRLSVVIVLLAAGAALAFGLWSGEPSREEPPAAAARRTEPPVGQAPPTTTPSTVPHRTDELATPRAQSPAPPTPTPEAPATAPPPQSPPPPAAGGDPRVTQVLSEAQKLVDADQLVQAREVLNRAYVGRKISPADGRRLREMLMKVNDILIFSPRVVEGDPLARVHIVQPGEYLSTIAPAAAVPWEFIARINQVDPNRIPAGKRLKLVSGPFHVVVHKGEFRLDVFLGDPTQPGSTYVRSFTVGLGESDSTPVGRFIVKRGKTINPDWRNPRTGEYFSATDPKNPIGERWIGIRGLDEASARHEGYGIHGTIEPQSIGRQASMGCVRMHDDDVALLFDLLSEEKSLVFIEP